MYIFLMNSKELKRWLAAQGCSFESKQGGGGHLIVKLGDKVTELPMHGHGRELKKAPLKPLKNIWD
jgi:mRNA interferase HicA